MQKALFVVLIIVASCGQVTTATQTQPAQMDSGIDMTATTDSITGTGGYISTGTGGATIPSTGTGGMPGTGGTVLGTGGQGTGGTLIILGTGGTGTGGTPGTGGTVTQDAGVPDTQPLSTDALSDSKPACGGLGQPCCVSQPFLASWRADTYEIDLWCTTKNTECSAAGVWGNVDWCTTVVTAFHPTCTTGCANGRMRSLNLPTAFNQGSVLECPN